MLLDLIAIVMFALGARGERSCATALESAPASGPGARRCDCMTLPAPAVARAQSDAVFLGLVDSIAPARLPTGVAGETYEGRAIHFRVLAAWSSGQPIGRPAKEPARDSAPRGVPDAPFRPARADSVLVVGTGIGGGDCGFAFQVGERYLVYAWGGPEALRTGICQRTRLARSAEEDLEALGAAGVDRRPSRRRQ